MVENLVARCLNYALNEPQSSSSSASSSWGLARLRSRWYSGHKHIHPITFLNLILFPEMGSPHLTAIPTTKNAFQSSSSPRTSHSNCRGCDINSPWKGKSPRCLDSKHGGVQGSKRTPWLASQHARLSFQVLICRVSSAAIGATSLREVTPSLRSSRMAGAGLRASHQATLSPVHSKCFLPYRKIIFTWVRKGPQIFKTVSTSVSVILFGSQDEKQGFLPSKSTYSDVSPVPKDPGEQNWSSPGPQTHISKRNPCPFPRVFCGTWFSQHSGLLALATDSTDIDIQF